MDWSVIKIVNQSKPKKKPKQNPGKIFEQDFANSVDQEKCWLYRFRDNAASFSGGQKTRFATNNICDYLMFHNETRTLYLFELKSTQGSSIPYTMLRDNQIEELTKASVYDLVAGFIFNFRKYDNATYFMPIDEFNEMFKENKKKSFNISDIKKYNVIEINSTKKITRYKYDIDEFIKNSHL